MQYVRLYAGPDGESHFEDVEVTLGPVEFLPGRRMVDLSPPSPAVGSAFIRLPADFDSGGRYNPPRRSFFVTLAGEIEVEASDGAVRRFGPGAVLLAEDTIGKGHVTRPVGGEWLGMVVTHRHLLASELRRDVAMDARDLCFAILPGDIDQEERTMRYARTFATPDGESHFEDVDVRHDSVEIVPGLPPIDVGERIATAYSNLLRIPPNWDGDWHPSPKRWFVLTLSGEMEITSSDGEIRRLGPGSIWLIEDTTGKGHLTRIIGDSEWVGFGVTLANP